MAVGNSAKVSINEIAVTKAIKKLIIIRNHTLPIIEKNIPLVSACHILL